MFISEDLNV